MTNHLGNLNDRQKEAVLHKDGPLLIIAGAGAGKTKTITHRILNLIKEGVRPENILAITFTNKAASEMRERTEALLATGRFSTSENREFEGAPQSDGSRTEQFSNKKIAYPENLGFHVAGPTICTFHSLGVKILKENHALLGLPRHFSILDEADSVRLVKEAVLESGLDPKQYDPRRFKNIISRQKGNAVRLEEFEAGASEYMEKTVSRIWRKYEELKKKEKTLDFDDLLLSAVLLLKENEAAKKILREKFKYIHVDEYQDTNQVQYELCRLLSGENKNICVVGDGDQNIYSWRGANLKNILNFERDYPGAKTILLEENYRSAGNILEAANEIIRKNKERKEKNLFTRKPGGEKISLYEAMDEKDEADFIASKILEIKDGRETSFEDTAILYRANFQSRALEEALLAYNIPYQVLGTKFFERKEVKDILSYLRAALNPESLSDIKRIINVPARGIGKLTILKIFAGQKEALPEKMKMKINSFYRLLENIREAALASKVSETIKYIIKETGLEESLKKSGLDEDLERLENVKELVTLTKKYENLPAEEGIEKLLEEAALMSDQDTLKEDKKGVKLMTVHASKGLEFDAVFISGLEQDLFPHRRDEAESIEEMEEERRLFYVALTRARKKLCLSFANSRMIFGSRQWQTPSEFLSDIPENLLTREARQYLNLRSIYF